VAGNKKRNRPAKPQKPRSVLPVPVVPTPQPLAPEPPKGRIRQAGSRLLDSAIDTALGGLWLGVAGTAGGVAMTALVTAILYLRAPESAWIYTLIKYALAYTGGMLTLLLMMTGFALLGVRRRKLIEKKNSARFKSAEKGYLDHWFHHTESTARFQSVLTEIGAEMARIGTCSAAIGQKLGTAGNDPKRAHGIVTKGAAMLDQHAARMERSIEALESVKDVLLESTMYLASNASPASEGNLEKLASSRDACVELLQKTEGAINGVLTFRQTAVAALGISQDTNSAMNRVIHGLDRVNELLLQAQEDWKDTLIILDRKLGS